MSSLKGLSLSNAFIRPASCKLPMTNFRALIFSSTGIHGLQDHWLLEYERQSIGDTDVLTRNDRGQVVRYMIT